MNFFQSSRRAPFLLNFQILFKKVQCQSSGYDLVKFDSNLMGRSKVYSVNKFEATPTGGDPEGQGNIFYAYDNLSGPWTNHVKFRENRPRGFRDIAGLVV